jgi:para-aminobenzoate synthetase/4-amino-4-deoxychorismate lyase
MNRWHSLPAQVYALVELRPATVLLECAKPGAAEPWTRIFTQPTRIIAANQPTEIPRLFAEIEGAVAAGHFAAGFFAYECGGCFEPTAAVRRNPAPGESGAPLAWFGLYERCYCFDHSTGAFVDGDPPGMERCATGHRGQEPAAEALLEAEFGLLEAEYAERIAAIHEWICAGEIYQLNFTVPMRVRTSATPTALYSRLRGLQPVEYGAFLHTRPGHRILSFSPELFFQLEDGGPMRRITTRPMKGTAPRGRTTGEDRQLAEWLRNDPKNRSENLMIVDLLRNDLGRLCRFGSVRAESLFAVERYPTLWQMTSNITGEVRPEVGFQQIFRALFPCGSITGAPKVRAMQLTARVEPEARGVYTGAIGYFSRQRTVFNVAIRTLELDGEGRELGRQSEKSKDKNGVFKGKFEESKSKFVEPKSKGEELDGGGENSGGELDRQTGLQFGRMGVGGGIIADSDAASEFRECLLKAEFLTGPPNRFPERFSLVETLLWREGFPLLELHLDRLEDSAGYFEFACERARVRAALVAHAATFASPVPSPGLSPKPSLELNPEPKPESSQFPNQPPRPAPRKVRLLLGPEGGLRIESAILPVSAIQPESATSTDAKPARVRISTARTDPRDRMLFHKTTHRPVYAAAYGAATEAGFDDVLFLNLRGEVTEGAISNIFIEKDGRWFTPPVECGLLAGVFRRHLLETRPGIEEKVLYPGDLRQADTVYLTNAVRGLRRAIIDWEN